MKSRTGRRSPALRHDHPLAHSRLAMAYEHLGQKQQAVAEYLAVASILQRGGNAAKAQEVVAKALGLMPQSPEARQADSLLKTGQPLPQPMRTKGGTGPLRMAKVKELQEPKARSAAPLDPVAEASQKAVTKLAEILFDYSDRTPAGEERRGLAAIVKGTGRLSMQHAEQAKVVLHLGPGHRRAEPGVTRRPRPTNWSAPWRRASITRPCISTSAICDSKAIDRRAPCVIWRRRCSTATTASGRASCKARSCSREAPSRMPRSSIWRRCGLRTPSPQDQSRQTISENCMSRSSKHSKARRISRLAAGYARTSAVC